MKKLMVLLTLSLFVLLVSQSVLAEEITILTWHHEEGTDVWEEIESNFNEDNPDIELNLVTVADNDFMEQKASTMIAGNIPLDVVWTDSSVNQALGKAGLLEPLEPYFEKDNINLDDYFTSSINDASWDGEIVGWPAVPMTYLIFYNKDLFDEAGVEYPENDWTIEEFLIKAQKLTDKDNYQYGYNTRPWIGTHDLAYVYAYGGNWFNEDNTAGAVTDPGTIKGYELISDLINEYEVAPSPSASSEQAGISFESGKIAMNWSGTWDIRGTETTPSKWGFDWGVVMPPSGPEGQFPIVISNNWSIVSRSQHKEAAWTFLKWWNSDKNQRYLAENGEFPSNIKIANELAFTHLSDKDRETLFMATDNAVARPTNVPVWARTERESKSFRDEILLGGDVVEILRRMEENINNIFNQ
ncbi:MAG: multiple sugar transport system substrate-binding protein [Candidatus Frackibacter sp. T328-2]|nr:MAG: multiple sugar transport system substrate-binding protein [Candidatus Frackibacter sp. T328-2]